MCQPHVSEGDARASEAVTTMLLIWFAIVIGLITAIGHTSRWNALIYDTARVVPGAPGTWGWTLFVFGVAAAVGYWATHGTARRWLLSGGLFMCSIWSLSLGLSFLNEYSSQSEVGALGVILMGLLTVLYMMRAVLFWGGARDDDRPACCTPGPVREGADDHDGPTV